MCVHNIYIKKRFGSAFDIYVTRKMMCDSFGDVTIENSDVART